MRVSYYRCFVQLCGGMSFLALQGSSRVLSPFSPARGLVPCRVDLCSGFGILNL